MIMKNNKLLIFAFALIGLFYSCDDAIDIKQPGEINNPDDVYNTVKDLDRGLNGVYATMSPDSSIEFTSIFTDETALGVNNGGQGINDGLYTFQLNAGTPAAESIWGANYSLINFANRILAASERIRATIEAIEDHESDEYINQIADINKVVGQLYAIRAYAHFQLLTYFSTDLKDDSALGVMILKTVPDENYDTFIPRSTNGEVFAFIEEDLATALTMMDPTSSPSKVSPRFVTALRARMAAYRGRYADVITYTSSFISTSGAGIYPLAATPQEYFAIWQDNQELSDREVIFEVKRVFGDFGIGAYWNTQSSTRNGSPFFEVGRALYNLYDANDIRGGISIIDPTSVVAPNFATVADYKFRDILVVNKYPGNANESDPLLNDIKVFRVSEMYLLRAEAFVALGNITGGASSAANVLRILQAKRHGAAVNAYPLPFNASTTPQQAYAAILNERRIELAFEGFRYIDIKRLGVLAGGLGIDRYTRDCALYNSCTLSPTDHRFTMPIPTSELIANPAISGQQNPGY